MFNSIDYIGISTSLPKDIKYFKEELFSTDCIVKENILKVDKIISVCVDTKIISMKLINTQVKSSNEGQKLRGRKLLVELSINYKIKYVSDGIDRYLYMMKHNITKAIYVVLPQKIKEEKIEELIRKKKIGVQVFIEDLYAKVRAPEYIYIRNLVLVNLYIKNN